MAGVRQFALEIYSNQINHLAYRLSADEDVRNILLANEQERDNNPSYYGYNDSFIILGQKIEEIDATFDNSIYIRYIKIMDRNGDVLLSSNPSETGHKIAQVDNRGSDSNSTTTNYGTNNIEINKVKDENRQLIEFTMPFKVHQYAVGKRVNSNANSFFISTSLDTNSFDKILPTFLYTNTSTTTSAKPG